MTDSLFGVVLGFTSFKSRSELLIVDGLLFLLNGLVFLLVVLQNGYFWKWAFPVLAILSGVVSTGILKLTLFKKAKFVSRTLKLEDLVNSLHCPKCGRPAGTDFKVWAATGEVRKLLSSDPLLRFCSGCGLDLWEVVAKVRKNLSLTEEQGLLELKRPSVWSYRGINLFVAVALYASLLILTISLFLFSYETYFWVSALTLSVSIAVSSYWLRLVERNLPRIASKKVQISAGPEDAPIPISNESPTKRMELHTGQIDTGKFPK